MYSFCINCFYNKLLIKNVKEEIGANFSNLFIVFQILLLILSNFLYFDEIKCINYNFVQSSIIFKINFPFVCGLKKEFKWLKWFEILVFIRVVSFIKVISFNKFSGVL